MSSPIVPGLSNLHHCDSDHLQNALPSGYTPLDQQPLTEPIFKNGQLIPRTSAFFIRCKQRFSTLRKATSRRYKSLRKIFRRDECVDATESCSNDCTLSNPRQNCGYGKWI